jgi:hypothetical protein
LAHANFYGTYRVFNEEKSQEAVILRRHQCSASKIDKYCAIYNAAPHFCFIRQLCADENLAGIKYIERNFKESMNAGRHAGQSIHALYRPNDAISYATISPHINKSGKLTDAA